MRLINEYFSADHDRLDALYEQGKALLNKDPHKAHLYLKTFAKGLEQHIRWEEKVLFPVFEKATGIVLGPTRIMRMEHEHIKAILVKILSEENSHPADLAELEQILASHNEKEEQILYPNMDSILSKQQKAEIFLAMAN